MMADLEKKARELPCATRASGALPAGDVDGQWATSTHTAKRYGYST